MAYTTINKGSDYFNTLIYTGDGTDDRSITGLGFQPDFCWFKDRTGANSHNLFDSVRGVNLPLLSNATNAELTGFDLFNSFDSDGFTISGATADNTNYNGSQFVSWSWKAANGTASNTNGSITSTVSANNTSGFSIVSFTGNETLGATVGHGLGAVPKVIIIKDRDNARNWNVYHASVCDSDFKFLRINTTEALITGGATHFDISAMSSTVFGLGADNESNPIASAIAYCFTDVKGFSKFGSYTGNGSAGNGPFVYTGFKPAWVLIKWTGGVEQWQIWDSKRDTYNVQQRVLAPNSSNAEDTNGSGGYLLIDSLSNGFKVRGNPVSNAINGSGQNYIYMAFAEQPLVGTNNIPTTAR
jgi:hypothetical protein